MQKVFHAKEMELMAEGVRGGRHPHISLPLIKVTEMTQFESVKPRKFTTPGSIFNPNSSLSMVTILGQHIQDVPTILFPREEEEINPLRGLTNHPTPPPLPNVFFGAV